MTQFLREIYEQPIVLRRASAHLTRVLPALVEYLPRPSQIVFTGMGSSFSAAYIAARYCVQHGIKALAFDTSELIETFLPLLDETTLLVVISQSGRTIEVLNLLDRVRNPVLAVTNYADSPLARRSTACLTIEAGEECTVSSKTYTATLAALSLLCQAWAGDLEAVSNDLDQSADMIKAFLPVWDDQIQNLLRTHESWARIVAIGRGASYASALTGALMCQEAAKLPAEGLSGGQFRHGFIESLSSSTHYFLFDHPLNRRLAHDLRRLGGNVMLITSEDTSLPYIPLPVIDDSLRPLIEIVPMQLLAARLISHLHIEPDVFRYGQKVVTQE